MMASDYSKSCSKLFFELCSQKSLHFISWSNKWISFQNPTLLSMPKAHKSEILAPSWINNSLLCHQVIFRNLPSVYLRQEPSIKSWTAKTCSDIPTPFATSLIQDSSVGWKQRQGKCISARSPGIFLLWLLTSLSIQTGRFPTCQ